MPSLSQFRRVLFLVVFTCAMTVAQTAPIRFAPASQYAVGASPRSVAVGDFNGDGKLDLAVGTWTDNLIYVLLGRGDGSFSTPVTYSIGDGVTAGLVVGDFTGDGRVDIAVVTPSMSGLTSKATVLPGNGDGTFGTHIDSPTGVSALAVQMADVDGDGRLDLLVGGNGSAAVLYGNGDGTFRTPYILVQGSAPVYTFPSVTAADINGDGHVDVIAVARGSGTYLLTYLGQAGGTLSAPVQAQAESASNNVFWVGSVDLKGDGLREIVACFDGDYCKIFTSPGGGSWVPMPSSVWWLGTTPQQAVFADFNADGKLDIAVADFNSSMYGPPAGFGATFVAGLGSGSLSVDYTKGDVGAQASSIAVGDFNGDGLPDLAITSYSTNTVDVLLNGGKTNVSLSSSQNPSLPNESITLSASVTDVAGDPPPPSGSVVFLDGNATLNTATLDVSGNASYSTTPSAGRHALFAIYSGDLQRPGSNSTVLIQNVGYPTSVSLTATPGSPMVGTPVSLAATASSTYADVNPGWIAFYDGQTFLRSVNLSNGSATLQWTFLAIGTHSVRAQYYSSSSSNLLSSSATTSVNVVFNSSTTTILSISGPQAGVPVTLIATVKGYTGVPTGAVNFTDSGNALGSAALVNGTATLVTSGLTAGFRTIRASYQGDGTYDPSFSEVSAQVGGTAPVPFTDGYDYVFLDGGSPAPVAYDSVYERIYVINTNYNRIDVIDALSHKVVAAIFPGGNLYYAAIDVSSDGKVLFVENTAGTLLKVDTQSLSVIARYKTGSVPVGRFNVLSDGTLLTMASSPSGISGHAFRWNYETGQLSDLGLGGVFAVSGDRKKAIFVNGAVVTLYDAQSNSVTATKTYSSSAAYPAAASANWDGSRFAVTMYNFISVLDGSLYELQQITSWASPTLSSDGTKLYAMNSSYQMYASLDVATATVLSRNPKPDIGSSNGLYAPSAFQVVTDTGVLVGSSSPGLFFFDPAHAATMAVPTTYIQAPSLSVSPAFGAASSTTSTTLQFNYSGALPAAALFGAGISQIFTNTLGVTTALAPPSAAAGPVNVGLLFADNNLAISSNGFSYGPWISRIDLSGGDPTGASLLRLYGYGFDSASQVTVGGVAAQNVSVSESGLLSTPRSLQVLTANAPAGTPSSTADITVTNAAGSYTVPRGYSYPKAITLYPKTGPLVALLYDRWRNVVYAANSSRIEVLDLGTRTFKAPFIPGTATPNSNFGRMALSLDGTRLYVSDLGETLIHVINPDTGEATSISTTTLGSAGDLPNFPVVAQAIAAMSDGRMMVSAMGKNGGTCYSCGGAILDPVGGVFSRFTNSFASLQTALATRGGEYIIIGSASAYDVPSGTYVGTNSGGSFLSLATLAASDDGLHVVSGYDLLDGAFNRVDTVRYPARTNTIPSSIAGMKFAAGGGLLFATSTAWLGGSSSVGTLDIFETIGGRLRLRYVLPEAPKSYSYADNLRADPVAVSSDGKTVIVATTTGLTVVDFDNLPLVIGSLTPRVGDASKDTAIVLSGSGFTINTTVSVGNHAVSTEFVDANTIGFVAPAMAAGCYAVTVSNPGGETFSWPCSYVAQAGVGVPVITAINPSSSPVGSSYATIVVTGSNFSPDAQLVWDGYPIPTTSFLSSTSLSAQAYLPQTASIHTVAVTNPGPGGGTSGSLNFSLTNVSPAAYSLTPALFYVGDPAQSLTISGYNLIPDSVVLWDGQPRGTAYVNIYKVTFNVTADDLATPGTHTVAVTNPAPGGGTTQSLSVKVVQKAPSVSVPSTLGFTSTGIGSSSSLTFGVLNNGYDTLTVQSTTITGDFQITSDGCSGHSIAVSSSCFITVSFAPTASGTRTGTVSIYDNASGSPHTVSLSGTGISGVASWSISSVTFDAVLVGSYGASVLVTLMNSGTAGLPVGGFATTGDFIETDNCPTILGPGSSCTITIAFRPSSLGSRTGNLASRAAAQPAITLNGTGADLALSLVRPVRSQRTGAAEAAAAAVVRQIVIASSAKAAVSLACLNAPAGSTCVLTPAAVTTGGMPVTVNVSLHSAAAQNDGGIYPVEVIATANGVSRSIDVPLTMTMTSPAAETTSAPAAETRAPNARANLQASGAAVSVAAVPELAVRLVVERSEIVLADVGAESEVQVTNAGSVAVGQITIKTPAGIEQANDCKNGLAAGAKCTIKLTRKTTAKSVEELIVKSEGLTIAVRPKKDAQ